MMSLIISAALTVVGADDLPTVKFPAEAAVQPGRLLKLSVETNGRKVKWVKPFAECDLIEFPDGKTAVFLAPAAGVYHVLVYTALNNEPSDAAVCKIAVGAPVPVPPVPVPPTPVPPAPVPPEPAPDPLTLRLREALKADAGTAAEKKEWVRLYSGFFEQMAAHVRDKASVTTVADLKHDYARALTPGILPTADTIRAVRLVAAGEFFPLVDDSETVIDDDLRKKLDEVFLRLAAALKAV